MTSDIGPSQIPCDPGIGPQDSVLPSQAAVEVKPEAAVCKVALVGEITFAGSRVARALAQHGFAVRVLCPDPAAEQAVLKAATSPPRSSSPPREGVGGGEPGVEPQANIEVVLGSLDSPEALAEVMRGVDRAGFVSPITMAGRAHRPCQHLQDVRLFIAAAQQAGVRKVVYHSALGALPKAASRALRDAAAAEEVVKAGAASAAQTTSPTSSHGGEGAGAESLFTYYLARTGPLMGPADGFLSAFVKNAKSRAPFVGVMGYGSTLVQPLHVDDFARCFARFFLPGRSSGPSTGPEDRPAEGPEELEGGRYALAGPEIRTLLELQDMALARLGRVKLKFHAPLFVLAAMAALSPAGAPVTSGKLPAYSSPRAGGGNGKRGGIAALPEAVGLRERVSLLLDLFATEHNDAPRLLGPSRTMLTPKQTQEELLSAE